MDFRTDRSGASRSGDAYRPGSLNLKTGITSASSFATSAYSEPDIGSHQTAGRSISAQRSGSMRLTPQSAYTTDVSRSAYHHYPGTSSQSVLPRPSAGSGAAATTTGSHSNPLSRAYVQRPAVVYDHSAPGYCVGSVSNGSILDSMRAATVPNSVLNRTNSNATAPHVAQYTSTPPSVSYSSGSPSTSAFRNHMDSVGYGVGSDGVTHLSSRPVNASSNATYGAHVNSSRYTYGNNAMERTFGSGAMSTSRPSDQRTSVGVYRTSSTGFSVDTRNPYSVDGYTQHQQAAQSLPRPPITTATTLTRPGSFTNMSSGMHLPSTSSYITTAPYATDASTSRQQHLYQRTPSGSGQAYVHAGSTTYTTSTNPGSALARLGSGRLVDPSQPVLSGLAASAAGLYSSSAGGVRLPPPPPVVIPGSPKQSPTITDPSPDSCIATYLRPSASPLSQEISSAAMRGVVDARAAGGGYGGAAVRSPSQSNQVPQHNVTQQRTPVHISDHSSLQQQQQQRQHSSFEAAQQLQQHASEYMVQKPNSDHQRATHAAVATLQRTNSSSSNSSARSLTRQAAPPSSGSTFLDSVASSSGPATRSSSSSSSQGGGNAALLASGPRSDQSDVTARHYPPASSANATHTTSVSVARAAATSSSSSTLNAPSSSSSALGGKGLPRPPLYDRLTLEKKQSIASHQVPTSPQSPYPSTTASAFTSPTKASVQSHATPVSPSAQGSSHPVTAGHAAHDGSGTAYYTSDAQHYGTTAVPAGAGVRTSSFAKTSVNEVTQGRTAAPASQSRDETPDRRQARPAQTREDAAGDSCISSVQARQRPSAVHKDSTPSSPSLQQEHQPHMHARQQQQQQRQASQEVAPYIDRLYRYRKIGFHKLESGRGCVGLHNLGNTCFMNSVLQALNAVPELVAWALDDQEHFIRPRAALAPAYVDFVQSVWGSKGGGAVSPNSLVRALGRLDRKWSSGSQQDAQELLHALLEGLQEDCNTIQGKPAYKELKGEGSERAQAEEADEYARTWHDSVVDDVFGGLLQSTLCCSVCKRKSYCYEPFLDLCVPIPSKSSDLSIQQCLQAFVEEERLEGSESVRCEACKKACPHTKKLQIWRPPHTLVLTLKRFAQKSSSGLFSRFRSTSKNSTAVSLEVDSLNLSPYCNPMGLDSQSYPGLRKPRYELAGISHHSGSLEGGHYTATARSVVDGQWYNFNDSHVRREGAPSGPSSSAYVLVYHLIQ